MANRSADWLAQAVRDLEQARSSRAEQRHEWACFAAQQSAEKAAKALHLARGQEGWGHVVARLLADLPFPVPPQLIDKAKVDLIAIVEGAADPFERRALDWDLLDLPVPAEIVVYTREEWELLRSEGGRFARTIERETVWLAWPIPPPGQTAA